MSEQRAMRVNAVAQDAVDEIDRASWNNQSTGR
jgi:hypothetical protein